MFLDASSKGPYILVFAQVGAHSKYDEGRGFDNGVDEDVDIKYTYLPKIHSDEYKSNIVNCGTCHSYLQV